LAFFLEGREPSPKKHARDEIVKPSQPTRKKKNPSAGTSLGVAQSPEIAERKGKIAMALIVTV
jgi:hypothetical protein